VIEVETATPSPFRGRRCCFGYVRRIHVRGVTGPLAERRAAGTVAGQRAACRAAGPCRVAGATRSTSHPRPPLSSSNTSASDRLAPRTPRAVADLLRVLGPADRARDRRPLHDQRGGRLARRPAGRQNGALTVSFADQTWWVASRRHRRIARPSVGSGGARSECPPPSPSRVDDPLGELLGRVCPARTAPFTTYDAGRPLRASGLAGDLQDVLGRLAIDGRPDPRRVHRLGVCRIAGSGRRPAISGVTPACAPRSSVVGHWPRLRAQVEPVSTRRIRVAFLPFLGSRCDRTIRVSTAWPR